MLVAELDRPPAARKADSFAVQLCYTCVLAVQLREGKSRDKLGISPSQEQCQCRIFLPNQQVSVCKDKVCKRLVCKHWCGSIRTDSRLE